MENGNNKHNAGPDPGLPNEPFLGFSHGLLLLIILDLVLLTMAVVIQLPAREESMARWPRHAD